MMERSANMLRQPKCICCVPIDTACFIFGIFSAVLSGIGVVILTLFRTWILTLTGDNIDDILCDDPDDVDWNAVDKSRIFGFMTTVLIVLFLYICCLISFIFSVFLCYGTHKRRPGFVKAYLVYGVAVTVLMMVGAILYSWLMADIIGGSVALIVCGLYSMLLLMVQRTHELIRAERARDSAQLLYPDHCTKA